MDPLEKEYERIRKLLETIDVSSDEADDESDSGEKDNLEVGHESTDTEQEMSDVASENELDTDCSDCYTGKDGETEWRKRKFKIELILCVLSFMFFIYIKNSFIDLCFLRYQ